MYRRVSGKRLGVSYSGFWSRNLVRDGRGTEQTEIRPGDVWVTDLPVCSVPGPRTFNLLPRVLVFKNVLREGPDGRGYTTCRRLKDLTLSDRGEQSRTHTVSVT